MNRLFAPVVALSLLVLFPVAAFAQEGGSVVAPSSIWFDLWTIVQPIVVLLVSTVGPVLVGWLSLKLSALLNTADAAKKKEIEAQLSAALHQSAMNALKFALAKRGLTIPANLAVGADVVSDAIDYMWPKNQDAITAFGLDDVALGEIVLSKVPDVKALAGT